MNTKNIPPVTFNAIGIEKRMLVLYPLPLVTALISAPKSLKVVKIQNSNGIITTTRTIDNIQKVKIRAPEKIKRENDSHTYFLLSREE